MLLDELTLYRLVAVHNSAGIIVIAVETGFFSGVVIAIPPVCFRITENKTMIGTRSGQGFAIAGLGLLLAGPSGSAILGTSEPLNWTRLWAYAGSTVCAGAVILFIIRFSKYGFALMVKC